MLLNQQDGCCSHPQPFGETCFWAAILVACPDFVFLTKDMPPSPVHLLGTFGAVLRLPVADGVETAQPCLQRARRETDLKPCAHPAKAQVPLAAVASPVPAAGAAPVGQSPSASPGTSGPPKSVPISRPEKDLSPSTMGEEALCAEGASGCLPWPWSPACPGGHLFAGALPRKCPVSQPPDPQGTPALPASFGPSVPCPAAAGARSSPGAGPRPSRPPRCLATQCLHPCPLLAAALGRIH